jgi:hypothetical protein
MSGPLTSEARGSTSELPLRPAQAVPGTFDFNWDANIASLEQGRAESVGRYDEERDSRLAYAAAQLAKETGQRPDAYMLDLGGEPGMGRPKIDEYHFWQDYAKLPAARRAAYGIGDNQADFDKRLTGEFQSDKQARAARIAKGGTIANLPGGLAGGFASPINQAMLAIPGLGEAGWAAKMAYEAASQAGAQTLATPFEMLEAKRQGGEETLGEAGQRIAMAGAGGAVLKGAHLAGGAAIDKALEVSRPWRTAQALRIATPEGKVMPPDQLAAAHVLERQAEVDATNPYQNSYQGIGTHRENVDQAQKALQAVPTPGQNFAEMLPGQIPARPALTPGQDLTPYGLAVPQAAGVLAAPRGAGAGFISDTIVDGLRQRGFSEGQARGIAAGIHAESRSDPSALNRDGGGQGAVGIGQWRGPRQAELHRRYGPNPSLDQQLDFLAWELHGGDRGGASVLAQSDPAAVLQAYVKDFMRPLEGPQTEQDLARGMEALGRPGEAPGEALPAGAPAIDEPPAPAIAEAPAAPRPEPAPAEVAPAGVLGERAGEAPGVPASEPLAVRDQVLRDGLVPVVRQIVADRGQSLANIPRLAEDLGVSPTQLHMALGELVANGELSSNREALGKLARARALEANRQAGAARKGSEQIRRQAAPVADEDVIYRRKAQPAANRGGDSLLQFISRNGGISEDGLNEAGRALGAKGHDLKETHGRFIPGHGPLIRKTGMSIDDMGERLWDAGYFGPPEVTPRPTENEVLGAIEREAGGQKIYSFWEDGPPKPAKISDFKPPDPDKVTSNEALVQTYQTWDPVAGELGIHDRFSLAEIDHAREIMARGTDSLPPLGKPEAEASPEELAPYLLEAVNRDIPAGETELDGDLQGAAVDSEEPTYEHYAAAAAQVDAAADRGGSRPAAPEAGPGREGAAGSEGDAGDQGAAQGVERPGQAGAVPGGERLPAAGRGGEPVTGATPDLTGAERDAANAAGNLGPVILDSEGLKAFDDPAGASADKAADDAWHDIEAAAEAKKPPAAKRKKGDENPLVRRGDTVTLTQDVDYLRAGETYTIERGNKKEAYFRNAETGGGTFLQNWTMKRALGQGHMKIEPREAPAEIPAAGHAASPEGAARPPEAGAPPAEAPAAPAGGQGGVKPSDPATVDILKLMVEFEDEGKYAPVDSGTQRVKMLLAEGLAAVDPQSGRVLATPKGRALIDAAEAPPASPSLDLGEQVDPNLAARQRQELDLAAQQPLRGARKTGAAQEDVMPEGLFGGKIEPRMLAELEAKGQAVDLGDGKGLRPIEEIHAELEDEAKAIDTIESCLLGRPTP